MSAMEHHCMNWMLRNRLMAVGQRIRTCAMVKQGNMKKRIEYRLGWWHDGRLERIYSSRCNFRCY